MADNSNFDPLEFCKSNFLFDAHSDIFKQVARDGYDILKRNDSKHFDIPRAKDGGLDVIIMAVCYESEEVEEGPESFALRIINHMNRAGDASGGKFKRITSKEDFESIQPGSDELGFIIGLEGGSPLKGDTNILDKLYDAGLRTICLTHDDDNEISQGTGHIGEPFFISGFGWEVIAACEEKGIMVDLAHMNQESIKFLVELHSKPFIISHTGCSSLCDHPHNLTDENLLSLGQIGCVVGIDLLQPHLKPELENVSATIEDVLNHIEYAAEIAGFDSVGLGTVMDTIYPLPEGLEDSSSYPAIAAGLNKRGWEDEDIAKVMGGNFRRVFSEVLPSNG